MTFVYALLIGLFVTRVMETIKEVSPWLFPAWMKSITATAGCVLIAWWLVPSHWILVGGGAAGLAMLLHETHAVMATKSDEQKQNVMLRGLPVARRNPRV